MQLIDQHTKKIMEGCKERARDAGLQFDNESLEYIVTNRDLIEISPKVMIPTLYDYWVHDVEVLQGEGRYDLYPSNPYETVINTRPAISFYNDNNPDWLNVMIFYHVLGHIDFFQNNRFFEHTWSDDFKGIALAHKRLIARMRSKHQHWVDYIIEFARGMDNLVPFTKQLYKINQTPKAVSEQKIDFFFDVFVQNRENEKDQFKYQKWIDRFNEILADSDEKTTRVLFINEVIQKYPEFEEKFKQHNKKKEEEKESEDLMDYIINNSTFLNKRQNDWMKSVIQVVRQTSLFFAPQIRTKIMNEGWATYWHEKLFTSDDRISGHEVDFAKIHAKVTSLNRVGLNPYAIGWRLFLYAEELADKGKLGFEFEKTLDIKERKSFDKKTGKGQDYIFEIRKQLCDSLFLRRFIDQDFVDKYRLFVAGKKLNPARRTWQYFVKSRKAEDYLKMLTGSLFHPPKINFESGKSGRLILNHKFEERPLVQEYIKNTLLGIEYLWGKPVELNTFEVKSIDEEKQEITWGLVNYTMKEKTLHRSNKNKTKTTKLKEI